MMDPANQQRVMDAFDTALKQDKMRSNILKISELGLVEMTRKRTRASLPQLLTEACPTCDGRGRIVSGRDRRLRSDATDPPGRARRAGGHRASSCVRAPPSPPSSARRKAAPWTGSSARPRAA
mgnify:CR=1 FL=1